MIKLRMKIPPIALTVLLLSGILFVTFNTISVPLLAQNCGVGPCECECIGKCFSGKFLVPYTDSFYYNACMCEDESESCSGYTTN